MNQLCLDLDGTLITCQNRQMSVLQAVASRDLPIDFEKIWELKRAGRTTQTALLEMGIRSENAEPIVANWGRLIEEPFWLTLDTVLDSVWDGLNSLRTRHWKLILLTARQHRHWLRQQLRQLGLLEYLDDVIVVGPREASQEKAAILHQVRPVAFIGDTESDGKAAELSQTRFIAVDTGQRNRAFLDQCGIRDCYDSFASAVGSLCSK